MMPLPDNTQVRPISVDEYFLADNFLEKHLYRIYNGNRPRSYEFLLDKLRENPELFLGLYLDNELIGVIEGFPRDDYLLLSEIAVDIRFRHRGFGTLLLREFENAAKRLNYSKIKLGAQDDAVSLYLKNNYFPTLLIQISDSKSEYKTVMDYLNKNNIRVLDEKRLDKVVAIELIVKKIDFELLERFKKLFNPISIQYLFTKNVC